MSSESLRSETLDTTCRADLNAALRGPHPILSNTYVGCQRAWSFLLLDPVSGGASNHTQALLIRQGRSSYPSTTCPLPPTEAVPEGPQLYTGRFPVTRGGVSSRQRGVL